MFACEQDQLGHIVLGSHDGLDSWTIHLSTGLSEDRQRFVSTHERAHHWLHTTTVWGTAMLISGLPHADGALDPTNWLWLGDGCRRTHEAYATWHAVDALDDGLDHLRGNYAYLAHLRTARALVDAVSDDHRSTVLDFVARAAMSPSWLADVSAEDLRSGPLSRTPRPTPDDRLAVLVQAPPGWTELVGRLGEQIAAGASYGELWDLLAEHLGSIGLPTLDAMTVGAWTTTTVGQFNSPSQRRIVLEAASTADRLSDLVDEQQRERLRLHPERLVLAVSRPDADPRPIQSFVHRTAELDAYIVLAWLHSGLLRHQFHTDGQNLPELALGFLDCDRRLDPALAFWLDLSPAPPSVVAHAVAGTKVPALLVTTLRTLDATADNVNFRGWDPAFVLIDSDALVFLRHSEERHEVVRYDIIGVGGDRTLDVLCFQRVAEPSLTYFLPCTAVTGRVFVAWMRERPESFVQEREPFRSIRPQLFTLVNHLLGILHQLHLWGWER